MTTEDVKLMIHKKKSARKNMKPQETKKGKNDLIPVYLSYNKCINRQIYSKQKVPINVNKYDLAFT